MADVFLGNLPPGKPVSADEVSYGTHTLPKDFWTSGKPALLKDPEFRARRLAKNARTARNKEARAEGNRNVASGMKRGGK